MIDINCDAAETTVLARGIRLFVRERGDGHPLLLVNGLGANAEMWGAAEDRLAGCARTIVFDAPGTGRSATPGHFLSMPGVARVVWSLVDELGYDRVDVLGYSLGGLVAQELARAHPQRVRRLALVATGCGLGSTPGSLQALAAVSSPLRYYSRGAQVQASRAFGDGDPDDARTAAARLAHPPSLLGYSYQLWASSMWSSRRWLSTVKTPTLVVSALRDRLIPPVNGIQLARLLPESRLHLLPDEGHMLMFDPSGAAHGLLCDFFGASSLEASVAWETGIEADDEIMRAALRASNDANPFGALYRWLAAAA
jgi:pimeloyl-ACP methyl ester carboxylesterase